MDTFAFRLLRYNIVDHLFRVHTFWSLLFRLGLLLMNFLDNLGIKDIILNFIRNITTTLSFFLDFFWPMKILRFGLFLMIFLWDFLDFEHILLNSIRNIIITIILFFILIFENLSFSLHYIWFMQLQIWLTSGILVNQLLPNTKVFLIRIRLLILILFNINFFFIFIFENLS
jgi:hypothetical protein